MHFDNQIIKWKNPSEEEIMWRGRAKIYRFVSEYDEHYDSGPQWKERGIGEVKFLKHKLKGKHSITWMVFCYIQYGFLNRLGK